MACIQELNDISTCMSGRIYADLIVDKCSANKDEPTDANKCVLWRAYKHARHAKGGMAVKIEN